MSFSMRGSGDMLDKAEGFKQVRELLAFSVMRFIPVYIPRGLAGNVLGLFRPHSEFKVCGSCPRLDKGERHTA